MLRPVRVAREIREVLVFAEALPFSVLFVLETVFNCYVYVSEFTTELRLTVETVFFSGITVEEV